MDTIVKDYYSQHCTVKTMFLLLLILLYFFYEIWSFHMDFNMLIIMLHRSEFVGNNWCLLRAFIIAYIYQSHGALAKNMQHNGSDSMNWIINECWTKKIEKRSIYIMDQRISNIFQTERNPISHANLLTFHPCFLTTSWTKWATEHIWNRSSISHCKCTYGHTNANRSCWGRFNNLDVASSRKHCKFKTLKEFNFFYYDGQIEWFETCLNELIMNDLWEENNFRTRVKYVWYNCELNNLRITMLTLWQLNLYYSPILFIKRGKS